MNQEKIYYRQWCKSCEDYTIHDRIYRDDTQKGGHADRYIPWTIDNEEDYITVCECGCQFTPVKLNDIPEEKILEQRKRFSAQRSKEFKDVLSYYGGDNMLKSLMSSFSAPGFTKKIFESDAGLKREEEAIKLAKAEKKQYQKNELLRFKNVGRNDICLCGSNKKYKKCCSLIHDTY